MEAASHVNLNIRVNADTKKEFEAFCHDMGMSMTTAITLFMRKTIREYRIPFDISGDVPNQTTLEAIREVEAMEKDPTHGKSYNSFEELLEDLDK